MDLSRCHICAALLPDTPEDRKDHVGRHKHVDKRLDAMTRSLHYLNGQLEEAHAEIVQLHEQLGSFVPTPTDAGGLTINEFPDDETDDTEPTVEDDADLAPTFDAVTTDLADLHDITAAPAVATGPVA